VRSAWEGGAALAQPQLPMSPEIFFALCLPGVWGVVFLRAQKGIGLQLTTHRERFCIRATANSLNLTEGTRTRYAVRHMQFRTQGCRCHSSSWETITLSSRKKAQGYHTIVGCTFWLSSDDFQAYAMCTEPCRFLSVTNRFISYICPPAQRVDLISPSMEL